MKRLQSASCSRGQIKIQEMAFVLLGIIFFLVLVGLFYFAFRSASLKENVQELRDSEAKEIVLAMTANPELGWLADDCISCIDFEKAVLMKNRPGYEKFWNLKYLAIEKLYPYGSGECTLSNMNSCGKITILGSLTGSPAWAFVSLCRQDENSAKGIRCELARIYASAEAVK